MKLYIFVIGIGFLFTEFSKIFCYQTRILYDQIFQSQFSKMNQTALAKDVKLIEIADNIHLTNATKYLCSENNAYVFTFTSKYHILQSNSPNQIDFQASFSTLTTKFSNSLNENCLRYTKEYLNTITSLIHSIFMKGVAIIGDDNYCTKQFVNRVVTILNNNIQTVNINFLIRAILYSNRGNDTEDALLSENLYFAKTSDISLYVLLSSIGQMSGILKKAEDFGLIDSSYIWLIPDYYDGMLASNEPPRVLKFQIKTDVFPGKPYTNLQRTVPELLRIVKEKSNEGGDRTNALTYVKPYLLHTVLENEKTILPSFHLLLSYRNPFENLSWSEVNAKWWENKFLLEKDNIPILRSLSGNFIRRFVRVVTVFDSPFTMEQSHMYDPVQESCRVGLVCRKPSQPGNKPQLTCCVGFVIEFFQQIIEDLNLEIELYISTDGNYGAFKQGRWNGMIGEINEGNADIAVAALTITADRSEVVDFTVPFMESQMGILVKPEIVELKFINWDFMAPLSAELQLALWAVIVGAMIMNYIFENNIYAVSLTDEKYVKEKYYPTFESMSYVSGVTLQRDLGGKTPTRPGARVSAVIFAFGMTIVVTTYTAVLAAQSVQNHEKDPFKGSQDPRIRNPTDAFRFAVVKSSSYETFFQKAETDVLKRMGVFMEKYNVNNGEEGFQKVRNGTLNAFINDYPSLYYFLSKDQTCELRLVSDSLLNVGLAFAISKNMGALKILIDEIMLKHLEQEKFVELQKKWFQSICQPSIYSTEQVKLSINHFGGLVLLLAVTAVCSVPLLFPEYIYYRYIRDRITNRIKKIFYPMSAKQVNKSTTDKTKVILNNDFVSNFRKVNAVNSEGVLQLKEFKYNKEKNGNEIIDEEL